MFYDSFDMGPAASRASTVEDYIKDVDSEFDATRRECIKRYNNTYIREILYVLMGYAPTSSKHELEVFRLPTLDEEDARKVPEWDGDRFCVHYPSTDGEDDTVVPVTLSVTKNEGDRIIDFMMSVPLIGTETGSPYRVFTCFNEDMEVLLVNMETLETVAVYTEVYNHTTPNGVEFTSEGTGEKINIVVDKETLPHLIEEDLWGSDETRDIEYDLRREGLVAYMGEDGDLYIEWHWINDGIHDYVERGYPSDEKVERWVNLVLEAYAAS